MVEEYKSIIKNIVWEVVQRLVENSVLGLKWIFNAKRETDGRIENYKDRFLAKIFSQVEGIYYEETFALIASYSSIRLISHWLHRWGRRSTIWM